MIQAEHIVARSIPEPNTGCWLWEAPTNGTGYGTLCVRGDRQMAHRASYRIFVADIPDGAVIDHKCRMRSCVNPDHLEPVTQGENLKRGDTGRKVQEVCQNGHPMVDGNLKIDRKRGKRSCLTCFRVRDREHKRAMRARRRGA